MTDHMKPLLKWPGGKGGEIPQIERFIPGFDRYVEPFAGGGALYFYLNPARALINDRSQYLMDFYGLVRRQDPVFLAQLHAYNAAFTALRRACWANQDRLMAMFRLYEVALGEALDIKDANIHERLCLSVIGQAAVDEHTGADLLEGIVSDREAYRKTICDFAGQKMRRTVANHKKTPMSGQDIQDNLVTGFLGGFYLYFREVFNRIAAGKQHAGAAERTANFVFVREYCYGSMFRYNAAGAFNIPYGGRSYNRKDFGSKIARFSDPRVVELLGRTELDCRDFEVVMTEAKLSERDFVFLDPPYDTEFSDYEGRDFTQKDHERLAGLLSRTRAKFLLVIKNTPFIYGLYEGSFPMYAFENRYLYNVRSRNDRQAEHLIITNCEPRGIGADAHM